MQLRRVVRSRVPGRRGVTVRSLVVLLGIGLGPGMALAQSGDFPINPGNPGEVPTYTIPAESCERIRDALDPTDPPPFDLVIACSIEGRGAEGRQTPCDLLGGGVNVGVPLGQCQDSFPFPLTTPDP